MIFLKDLSQEDADNLIRNLKDEPLENFKAAFDAEKDNMKCLPQNMRRYYLAYISQKPYLLVGINPAPAPGQIVISSFAKIYPAFDLKYKANKCLRVLIEEKLVRMLHDSGREVICTRLRNKYAVKIFKDFKIDLPKGIEKVISYPMTNGYWPYVLFVRTR